MSTNKPTNTSAEKEGALQDQNSFNGNYTAIPKSISSAGSQDADLDLISTPMDAGEMNEDDAIKSGYMKEEDRTPKEKPTMQQDPDRSSPDRPARHKKLH